MDLNPLVSHLILIGSRMSLEPNAPSGWFVGHSLNRSSFRSVFKSRRPMACRFLRTSRWRSGRESPMYKRVPVVE